MVAMVAMFGLVALMAYSSDVTGTTQSDGNQTGVSMTPTMTPDDNQVFTHDVTSNNTSDDVTEVTDVLDADVTPMWSVIMDRAQFAGTSVGVVANAMTFITLLKVKAEFNPTVLFFLRHQSIIDGVVCLSSSLLMVLPPMWRVGHYGLDTFICHVWHSQEFYWQAVLLSIWSLIMIAVERFLAVCYPFKHQVSPAITNS